MTVPSPNSLCPYFQIFDHIFFADAPPISQNEALSNVNFSIIHLVRTVCELTFNYTDTQHSDDFILYTKSFSIEDCRTLSQKQCTVCAAFADANAPFLERSLSDRSLFPWCRGFFLLFISFVQSLDGRTSVLQADFHTNTGKYGQVGRSGAHSNTTM